MTDMENNNENRAKFSARYFGQKVSGKYSSELTVSYLKVCSKGFLSKDMYLLLRPLSSITDDEAIEVAKILSVYPEDVLDWLNGDITHEDFQTPFQFQHAIDYLRSIGIALPYMGLSVEKQVEYGWIKLKENDRQ